MGDNRRRAGISKGRNGLALPDARVQGVLLLSRISDISLPEDFEVEAKREDLRDRRWRRYRSMLYAFFAGIRGLTVLIMVIVLVRTAPAALTLLKLL